MQVEFYFSDANILKDAFLLKHVRRNKQGYVSLKLITSFRKMKSLSKDYREVAFSLRQSEHLEVNEEGTKVRRGQPLPDYDETTPSRSVVAVNLPFENPTIENVAELFKPCGDIALIRVLRPGKPIPTDVKKHLMKHPELDNAVCAVVEFEQHESAKKAVGQMTNGGDWRKGLRVVMLGQAKKDKANKSEDQAADGHDSEKNADDGGQGKEGKRKKNRKKKASRVAELAKGETGAESPSSGSDGDETKRDMMAGGDPQEMRRKSSGAGIPPSVMARTSLSPNVDVNRLSPRTTPRSSPRNTPISSPRSSPRGSPDLRRKAHGKSPLAADALSPGTSPKPSPHASPDLGRRRKSSLEMGSSPGGSPWVQRRLKAQQEAGVNGRSPGTSPRLGRRLLDLEGVVRQPKGPDGTPGFYGGAGRGKPAVPSV